MDERALSVEDWGACVEEGHESRIPLFFLGIPLARALAEACGHPLTATSANRSGEPAVEEVAGIAAIAADRRVVVLDAGRTPGGAPSTIVDARVTPIRIIRHGAVPSDRVLRSIHE